MRVGIDAFALGNQLDGTKTYVRNLVRALSAMDDDTCYTLFVGPRAHTSELPPSDRMRTVVVGPIKGKIRLPFASSLALSRARLDVFHAQFAAPLVCPARIVVTVHDILFERYPQFFSASDLRQLRLRVPLTLRRASAIITVSHFSKQDIVKRFAVSPDRVVVAPDAADPMFRPVRDQQVLATARERYGTGERFVLFVGALKPNKNVTTLLEAFIRLRRADQIRHRLVLVGAAGARRDEAIARVREAGYEHEVVFTGHVSDEDLVALYAASDLFVQPSLFEGFGLPALEAMACGTPVISTNVAAIPEVVGDAALLVNSLDADALANAMMSVLHSDDLRARMSAQGLERAATFTWEASAATVVRTYHEVMARPAG